MYLDLASLRGNSTMVLAWLAPPLYLDHQGKVQVRGVRSVTHIFLQDEPHTQVGPCQVNCVRGGYDEGSTRMVKHSIAVLYE
jgi:hypothetical protein